MTKIFIFLVTAFSLYASEIPATLEEQLVRYDIDTAGKSTFEKNPALLPWHNHHRSIIGEFLRNKDDADALKAFNEFNTVIDAYIKKHKAIGMDQLMLAVYGYGILIDHVHKVKREWCEDYQNFQNGLHVPLLDYVKVIHHGFADDYGSSLLMGLAVNGIWSIFSKIGLFGCNPNFFVELNHALEQSRLFPYIAPSAIVTYENLNHSFALRIPLCGLSLEQVGYDGIPTPSVVDGFCHDFRFHVFPSISDENNYYQVKLSKTFVADAYKLLFSVIDRSSILHQYVLFFIGHETPFCTENKYPNAPRSRKLLSGSLNQNSLRDIISTAIKTFSKTVDDLSTDYVIEIEGVTFKIKRLCWNNPEKSITVLDLAKRLERLDGPITVRDVVADCPNAFATTGIAFYNSLFELRDDILQVPVWINGKFNASGIKSRFREIFDNFLSEVGPKLSN